MQPTAGNPKHTPAHAIVIKSGEKVVYVYLPLFQE